ncbi:MAG: ABC transporter permease [Actinobacteria bacterium]|nr:MAG: ABC transporter permease [Actinomycetota bacterium]
MAVYADLFRYRELFGNLFRRDLQAKYKGSVLGVAWSLVNPLVLLGIYLLVFSLLWKAIPVDHPALFLLSGLAIWIFFSTSIHAASRSMLDNANLIRKTRFPRQLVPLSVVATNLVSFGVMMAVLLALDFALLPRVRGTMWLALPLGLALVGLTAGLALAVASANVVFRDVEHLIGALLLPWFFLTPILWIPSAFHRYHGVVRALHWANLTSSRRLWTRSATPCSSGGSRTSATSSTCASRRRCRSRSERGSSAGSTTRSQSSCDLYASVVEPRLVGGRLQRGEALDRVGPGRIDLPDE